MICARVMSGMWPKVPSNWSGKDKILPSLPEKGTNVVLEGKIKQWIRILERKLPRGTGILRPLCSALTSSIESCGNTSKPHKNNEISQMNNKNQGRWLYLVFFILFKKVTFYFIGWFYSGQILNGPKHNTTLHTLGGYVPLDMHT